MNGNFARSNQMRFVLRNRADKFMVFDEKIGSVDMMHLIGARAGGEDDPLTQFLFQFENGEIPQAMCDQITKALIKGFNEKRFFKATEWYLGGYGERTVIMQLDEKWNTYLALFHQGPVTVIRTVYEKEDILTLLENVLATSEEKTANA
jgi:hypothetical protein